MIPVGVLAKEDVTIIDKNKEQIVLIKDIKDQTVVRAVMEEMEEMLDFIHHSPL